MNYFLAKTDPDTYSMEDFKKEKKTKDYTKGNQVHVSSFIQSPFYLLAR